MQLPEAMSSQNADDPLYRCFHRELVVGRKLLDLIKVELNSLIEVA